MKKSHICGVMLKHTDGDREYYAPALTEADESKIYKVLEKYGDDNESSRGALTVYDADAEKLSEAARRLYNYMSPWDRNETTEEETREEIRKNPLDTILFLLDELEN